MRDSDLRRRRNGLMTQGLAAASCAPVAAEPVPPTAAARCDFTDLPADQCAHCLKQPDPVQAARADRARLLAGGHGWTAAQWPGMCEHCGERFPAGAAIRMEMPTGWRAECCATT